MRDITLYQSLLGLSPPWLIEKADLRLDEGKVVLHVAVDEGTLWGCPKCAPRMHFHDYHVRRWRRPAPCPRKTIIEVHVPRVKCPEHGTMMVRVPWAEPHGRFTALFERLTIDLMLDFSIKTAGKCLRVTSGECDRIKARAVERDLRRKGEVATHAVCIDEKSVGRGHDYVAEVTKLADWGSVRDYIGDGRDEYVLDALWKVHSATALVNIACVSIGMWKPCIKSVEVYLPAGARAIAHTTFHIIQHTERAVDSVRRKEANLLPHDEAKTLKETRQMWLNVFESLGEEWGERLRALKDSQINTARAWRLKETLRAMYQCATAAQADALFAQWYRDAMRGKLGPAQKVARMLKKYPPQRPSYFIRHVSNAYSGGMNSMIQALIKRTNSYRSCTRLKRDRFFHLGALDLYPSITQ